MNDVSYLKDIQIKKSTSKNEECENRKLFVIHGCKLLLNILF